MGSRAPAESPLRPPPTGPPCLQDTRSRNRSAMGHALTGSRPSSSRTIWPRKVFAPVTPRGDPGTDSGWPHRLLRRRRFPCPSPVPDLPAFAAARSAHLASGPRPSNRWLFAQQKSAGRSNRTACQPREAPASLTRPLPAETLARAPVRHFSVGLERQTHKFRRIRSFSIGSRPARLALCADLESACRRRGG